MSSFATAASRIPKDDNGAGKQQLHLLVNPDAPRGAAEEGTQPEAAMAAVAGAAPALGVNPHSLEEVARVERLLTQLEARSMALVPYGYGTLREAGARKSNNGIIAAVLVGIWISSIVLVVAYLKYGTHTPGNGEAITVTSPTVINPEGDSHEKQVAQSVDSFAKALANSSQRMNELQAAMERSAKDMQKLNAAKQNSGSVRVVAAPAGSAAARGDEAPAAAEPALPRNWHKILLEVKPTDAAVPHKAADGSIDYWLVPRNGETTKVLTIGTSADGVLIHSLDDGKDYTLTPSGEWRAVVIGQTAN